MTDIDAYLEFINALQADEDFPAGAKCTPIYGHLIVNVRFEKTEDVAPWQVAVGIDRPITDALRSIVEQHERARFRVAEEKQRQAHWQQMRDMQEDHIRDMKNMKEDLDKTLQKKRHAITQRHEKKEGDVD